MEYSFAVMINRFVFLAVVIVGTVIAAASRAEERKFPPSASIEEIRQRIADSKHTHPRLLTTREQLAGPPKSLAADPLRRELADGIVQEAMALRDAPPVERKLEGRRLL